MRQGRSIVTAGLLTLAAASAAVAWGVDGHRMVSRAAVEGIPADVPAFFTAAADQLAYLGPEPDRWRDDELSIMDEAWKYDHYIDLEAVPGDALEAPDRYRFIRALYAAGVDRPEQAVGFLPYRILELHQRLTTGFARWRMAGSRQERRWIEARIINDAGVLGHYVADAANPHHTTIHFNGWAETAPNPRDFTTDRDFHWSFESRFVGSAVDYAELQAAVPAGVTELSDVRAAVMDYLAETHADVTRLYELERSHGFDPRSPAPETEAFAIQRLAAGAAMLRDLWYSAWVRSAALAERGH